jgi:hypothetical protein
MNISWFGFFRGGPQRDATALDGIAAALRHLPGLTQGQVFSPPPADTAHPFPDNEPAPPLALQLQFATIEALEAALVPDGAIAALGQGTEQAMLTRRFPVPDPTLRTPSGALPCSYLVHYPGPAADLNAWNAHYNAHHPPVMAKFPGVRVIEIYTRLDWVSGLGWPKEDAMQRNKLLFDSPAALTSGLAPEVMQEMRADFHRFPAFEGGNTHYALLTRIVRA